MIINSKKGSMLLMAFYVIVSLISISAAFVMMMVNDRLSTARLLKTQQAEALAEAGLERGIAELRADFHSNQNWADGHINGQAVIYSTDEDEVFIPLTAEGKGTYQVWLKNVAGKTDEAWIKAIGTVGDSTVSLQAYVSAINPSDWTIKVILWQKI